MDETLTSNVRRPQGQAAAHQASADASMQTTHESARATRPYRSPMLEHPQANALASDATVAKELRSLEVDATDLMQTDFESPSAEQRSVAPSTDTWIPDLNTSGQPAKQD